MGGKMKKNSKKTSKNAKTSESAKKPKGGQAFQVIDYSDVLFEHPHPDVHVAKILIANASWINTTEGQWL